MGPTPPQQIIPRYALVFAALVLGGSALAACHDNVSALASSDAQICYRLPTGDPKATKTLSVGDANLETCAMHVEAWRLMHKALAATGLYQGHMVFASGATITSSTGPKDVRYRVYTPGQQADIDQKVQYLIAHEGAGDSANTTSGQ